MEVTARRLFKSVIEDSEREVCGEICGEKA